MNTFTHCPKKRLVQETLFKAAGNGHTATVLLGPNPDDYLELLRKYVTSTSTAHTNKVIYGYDFNPTVRTKTGMLVFKTDIVWARATSFIDLDLCSTLTSGKYLMYSLFEKQKLIRAEHKAFLVTFALRDNHGRGVQDILSCISEMIGASIRYTKRKFTVGFKYVIDPIKGYNVEVHTYRDSMSMISILIKYR